MSWIDVADLNDIPLPGARVVKTHFGDIGLFRTGEAQVFATSNACTQDGGPLSEGIVHGTRVACPIDNSVFDLETGALLGTGEGHLQTYPVRLDGTRVLLERESVLARGAA
ncbi:nitrite reductase (NAD(P)H) small subunit [Pacificoceanicola onchidii]|uniref:nitrite reductase (NAD(P)H) small subunit n=1 Tax=Pacificoceanicola onchidii TaxID=2562685 RepID=UPI0010A579DB|nr:nitrite reductase (NAD(P)H) small subunit [Pacificoceanicola onchidii]